MPFCFSTIPPTEKTGISEQIATEMNVKLIIKASVKAMFFMVASSGC
jgi:hypothetical protein